MEIQLIAKEIAGENKLETEGTQQKSVNECIL